MRGDFELAIFPLGQAGRSNQLNYIPEIVLLFCTHHPIEVVGGTGLEPVTYGL
jgi:hypothetical protein